MARSFKVQLALLCLVVVVERAAGAVLASSLAPSHVVALLVHDWAAVRDGWTPVVTVDDLAPHHRARREAKDRFDAWFQVTRASAMRTGTWRTWTETGDGPVERRRGKIRGRRPVERR